MSTVRWLQEREVIEVAEPPMGDAPVFDDGGDEIHALKHYDLYGVARTWCGQMACASDRLPPEEVTEEAWCTECVRLQDAADA